MDPQLKQLGRILKSKFGPRLRQVVFFGSRARGDATAESDYDCLLVFNRVDDSLEKELDHLSARWLLDQGIVFSWIAMSEDDLDRFRYEPFLQNARREGIAL